jgi:hypothetical protein
MLLENRDGRRLDVDAVQHLVEQHAVDAAPHAPQLERCRVPELGQRQRFMAAS